jgi:hypothetical protein
VDWRGAVRWNETMRNVTGIGFDFAIVSATVTGNSTDFVARELRTGLALALVIEIEIVD